MSTAMDLRYPDAVGRRSPLQPLLNWYLDRFFETAAGDFAVLRDFMRVLHLLAPPSLLARPSTVARVLGSSLGAKRARLGQRPPRSAYTESGVLLAREGA